MAAFVAPGNAVLAPNPLPERGCSIAIDASPDGRQILYVNGHAVVVRDVKKPELCRVYSECKRTAKVARFSRDGSFVAVGDSAGMVAVFKNDHTMETKKELMMIGGAIADLSFDSTGKRLAAVGDGKGTNARCVMWESGSAQGEVTGSSKRLLSCSISEDGKSLAVASEDSKVRVYKGPPYKFSASFDKHTNFVQCCRYSPCGRFLATSGSDQKINILDAESLELVKTLPAEHKGSVFSVSWSADGNRLLSASGDKSVKLWDVEAGTCLGSVTAGKSVFDMQAGCVFAGDQAISVSLSGDINYLDFESQTIARVISAHTGTPTSVVSDASQGAGDMYVAGSSGNVYMYSKEGTARRFEGVRDPKPNDGLVLRNNKLYSVAHDDTLRIADLGEGCEFSHVSCSTGGTPLGLAVGAADPDLVAVILESTVLLIQDRRVVDTKTTSYQCTCVAMSPDSKEVLVGGKDKAVHVFKVEGAGLVATDEKLVINNDAAASLCYSVDGKLIAVGESKDEVSLWEADTKKAKMQDKWKYHLSKVLCVAFSPSGQHVVSCGIDGQILVWNINSMLRKTKLERTHALGVNSVAWLDDSTIVSAGNDGCLRKWTPKLP